MLKKTLYILFASLLLLIAFTLPNWFAEYKNELDLKNFQSQFIQKEALLDSSITQLKKEQNLNQLKNFDKYYSIHRNHDISLLLFTEDSLRRWNQDELQIDKELLYLSPGVYQFSNGWYYLKRSSLKDDCEIVGLLKIMSQYSYQNKHLRTSFGPAFQFQTIEKISESKEGHPIQNIDGEVLFYLRSKPNFATSDYQSLLFFIAFILSAFCLLSALRFVNQVKEASIKIAVVLGYRLVLFYFSPEYLEYVEFFRPNWYAINEWIPSFADFLINSIVIFYLSIELNNIFKNWNFQYLNLLKNSLAVLLGLLAIEWIESSISNSTFSYNLVNFFEWNIFSFCSLLGFALLLMASTNLIYSKSEHKLSVFEVLILLLLSGFLSFAYNDWQTVSGYHFWLIIPIVSIRFFDYKSMRTILLIGNLVYLSVISAFLISENFADRESSKKQILVKKLAEEKDVVAEYLFQSIDSLIKNDEILINILNSDKYNLAGIENHLNEKYFSGYWNKYSIIYYPCFEGDTIVLNNEYSLSCFDYYHDKIKYEGEVIDQTSFYQLSNLAGRIDYLAELDFSLEDSNKVNLYIELSSSIVNQFVGYPELLIDERSYSDYLDFSKYSYAVYHKSNLVFKSGDYQYPISIQNDESWVRSNSDFNENEFVHTPYKKNEETIVVLSEKEDRLTDNYTRIAYLLILFSVIVSIFSVFPFDFTLKVILNWNDFASRIQVFLLGTLLVSVTLFLIGTLFYIQKQNEEKNNRVITEKLRSVRIEMESKIGGERAYNDSLVTYYNALLIKFSNVFYTDINLFDNTGQLFATSRPEVYDKGLKSKRIHPMAFSKLVLDDRSEWVQKEHIGDMEYTSAYVPIRNDYNKILGYLNLPYFAKQEELEKEISDFFVSAVNIYVAIFALALFISVLLVNQLSRPLSFIRQQISKLKLGGDLELIEWKGNDEIGALVNEYNRMVVELSDSVERLAQSEREGAWREMAKQVAHEIKNPLTPMKLSIQHLQMAYDKKAEDLDIRLKKTSQTLIEQIDTLTNIANEFSHFAKMPEGKIRVVDLMSIIDNAIHLYDTYEEVDIKLESTHPKLKVKGDEDQLLRLFNNLLKNSIQAKTNDQKLNISITLSQNGRQWQIDIKDNGRGVQNDKKEKIFEPNFTTKSSGTGLGLPMSRSIVKNMGGNIKLIESSRGAHFRILLPIEDE